MRGPGISERIMWTIVYFVFSSFIRPAWKWLLHVLTGKSEIERILLSKQMSSSARVKAVEYALKNSRSAALRGIPGGCPIDALNSAVDTIIRLKYVESDIEKLIRPTLTLTLARIIGYHQVLKEVEWLRKAKFERTNADHERLLLRLWENLMPGVDLKSPVTKQWQEIGFQGDDPSTDFRGMGLLGLVQLVYFSESETDHARRLLSRSLHPVLGCPFSVAGINFTSMMRDLLRHGFLKNYFYNHTGPTPTLEAIHKCYCCVFMLFDDMWVKESPENVMAFNGVRERLYQQLVTFFQQNEEATFPGFSNLKRANVRKRSDNVS